jgi:Transposase
MKKISTVQVFGNEILKGQKLTIGLDLGDRWSFYCVLDEAGKILLEQKVATTPEAMKQTFGKIPRSLIAIETGTHSPWVSRLLTELGHEVIVAHAQKVELITKSNRKDDRHDARTLARLARIDPELLGPVRHRSAKAQIHLTVIRAPSRTGECSNGVGECSTRVGEILWPTAAQAWHVSGEPGASHWIERRVAGCSRAVAQRGRIAERAMSIGL